MKIKSIPGFPDYKANNKGEILSFNRNPLGVKMRLRKHNLYPIMAIQN